MAARRPKAAAPALAGPDPRLGDPRRAAQALRRALAGRVDEVLAGGGLDKATAEELAKIGASLNALEKAGTDPRAAALEVMERFGDFAAQREADPARRAWLADLVAAFFQSLEEPA